MQKTVSFIGLGVMGYHMAGHLTKQSDYKVQVYNRSAEKAKNWAEEFDGDAVSLATAASADVICLCLGRDEDVLAVVEQTEFLDHLKSGSILIDHTTTSFDLAQKLHELSSKCGASFLDAPVSGGEAGAVNGTLTTMVGGDHKIFETVLPLLKTYCKKQTHMGAVGYGQLAKMVNQIAIVGILTGLSEAIKFAENEGLDMDILLSAISGGAAQSWQMENRMQVMHERSFDFGFALKWMIKDLGYCLDRAKQNKTDLALVKKAIDQYRSIASKGGEDYDTSSLILDYDDA